MTAIRVPEKTVQAAVIRLYRQFGCVVNSLSQPRATMQTPGIPDLYIHCTKKAASWWHETKAVDGKPSEAQLDFFARENICGGTVVLGGVDAAKLQLRAIGLIKENA